MTWILGRYLSRLLLARLLLILFALVSMATLLDLLANSDEIIKPDSDVAADLGRYVLLRLPGIVSQIVPISLLIAALVTLAGLSRSSELTAIMAAGISPFRQIAALLPAALLVAAGQFLIEDQAVPSATAELRDWGVGDYGDFASKDGSKMTWFRQADNYVRVRRSQVEKDVIRDVTIFHRDPEGRLIERIEADHALYKEGVWILQDVTRTGTDDSVPTKTATLEWPEAIEISILHALTLHPKELSYAELRRLADRRGFGNRPLYLYEMWMHKKVATRCGCTRRSRGRWRPC
jgi:lipopolysaccharide export system permease protein